MITPKELQAEYAIKESENYAKGLEVAEAVSENMRSWADQPILVDCLFVRKEWVWIKKEYNKCYDLVFSDLTIRKIVFQELNKAGWYAKIENDSLYIKAMIETKLSNLQKIKKRLHIK